MKKIYFTFSLILLTSLSAICQTGSATIFSEMGEKFTAYLNGEQKNSTPQSNVKLSGLSAEYFQLRVDFEDAALTDFMDNSFAVQFGMDASYMIKKNKKGEYVCRFQSAVPMGGATVGGTTVVEPVDDETKKFAAADDMDQNIKTVNTTGTTITTNTTGTNTGVTIQESTTTTTRPIGGEKVAVNMNVNGVNMGIDINVTDGMQENMGTVTTTTTTTTNSTAAGEVVRERPVHQEEVVVSHGCTRPMDKASFSSAKSSIASKGFDETRLTLAKQVTKSNCLYASQIVEVMSTFGFEETKLDFAKYAYDHCFDPNNYYVVSDAFSFNTSIEELNQFIESK